MLLCTMQGASTVCFPSQTNVFGVNPHVPGPQTRLRQQSACPYERNLSLLIGLLIMVSIGSAYAISAWNAQLQKLLDLTHIEISSICSLASFGLYLSPPAGAFYDVYGVRWCILAGCIGLTLMYSVVALSLFLWTSRTSALFIGVCFVCIGQASDFALFAALNANESLFGAQHRGKIVAVLFSGFTAGGAIFAYVFHHLFQNDVVSYFQFMAMESFLVTALGVLFLCPESTKIVFNEEEQVEEETTSRHHTNNLITSETPLIMTSCNSLASMRSNTSSTFPDPRPHQDELVDQTGWEMLHDARFWLIFIPVLSCIGSALFILNNISFIVQAYPDVLISIPDLVALFSTFNVVSRLLIGTMSDKMMHRCPRSFFFIVSTMMFILSFVLFLTLPIKWVWLPVCMVGFAEGTMFVIFPVLVREMFGAKHFGKNFGTISIANAVGYPLILGPLSSVLYSYEQQKAWLETTGETIEECVGPHCFRAMFTICLLISILSLICSVKLYSKESN